VWISHNNALRNVFFGCQVFGGSLEQGMRTPGRVRVALQGEGSHAWQQNPIPSFKVHSSAGCVSSMLHIGVLLTIVLLIESCVSFTLGVL